MTWLQERRHDRQKEVNMSSKETLASTLHAQTMADTGAERFPEKLKTSGLKSECLSHLFSRREEVKDPDADKS